MQKRSLIIASIISILCSTAATAQLAQKRLFPNSDISTNIYFQTWGKKNDRISQFSMPVIYVLPLNQYVNIDVTTGFAFSRRTTAARRLAGPIDTRVRVSYLTLRDRVLLSAFVTAPTGKSRLEGDQNEVASALSDDALAFRVPNYGHGTHLNLAAVYAFQIRRGFVLGAGFGYLLKTKFQPLADDDLEYLPGDEITFTLGVDVGKKKFKLSGDASYILYETDKINDEKVFKSGNKLFLNLRWIYTGTSFGLTLFARNRTKGKNERGLGILTAESNNSNGNQLDIGGIGSISMGQKTKLLILGDTKIYAKNQYGDRGALIFSIGGGLQRQISRKFSYQTSLRLAAGSLRSGSGSETIIGIELGGGIVIRL